MHHHLFDEGSQQAEPSARLVMWITAVTMLLEITSGRYKVMHSRQAIFLSKITRMFVD